MATVNDALEEIVTVSESTIESMEVAVNEIAGIDSVAPKRTEPIVFCPVGGATYSM